MITLVIFFSQTVQYSTCIYTSDNLAEEISKQKEKQETRGHLGNPTGIIVNKIIDEFKFLSIALFY